MQVIVACDASDQAPDARLLEGSLGQLAENLAAIDAELPAGAALLGDAGYCSEHNVVITARHGLDPYLSTGRVKHADAPAPAPSALPSEHATPKQAMADKLTSAAGAALYARRKTIVEPVFGQIDTVQHARRLLLRGERAARAQWRFHCAIHNLLKLHRNGGLALIPTG
jgi:Transposase DDE domain